MRWRRSASPSSGRAGAHAIAGHLVASSDQSGRRFPFLMMRTLEVGDPAAFVSRCPLALEPLWAAWKRWRRGAWARPTRRRSCRRYRRPSSTLDEQATARWPPSSPPAPSVRSARCWAARRRQLILALGLLLQPVMQSGAAELEKSLVLPLPVDADARYPVAAFWLELIAPFLGRADFELALFITRIEHKPVLVIGFCGAAAQTLHAIIDPLVAREQQVSFADTGWVDEQVGLDVDVRALASYLDQPQLPLKLARELFLQTFIGVTT